MKKRILQVIACSYSVWFLFSQTAAFAACEGDEFCGPKINWNIRCDDKRLCRNDNSFGQCYMGCSFARTKCQDSRDNLTCADIKKLGKKYCKATYTTEEDRAACIFGVINFLYQGTN